jgi:hypothetical protein
MTAADRVTEGPPETENRCRNSSVSAINLTEFLCRIFPQTVEWFSCFLNEARVALCHRMYPGYSHFMPASHKKEVRYPPTSPAPPTIRIRIALALQKKATPPRFGRGSLKQTKTIIQPITASHLGRRDRSLYSNGLDPRNLLVHKGLHLGDVLFFQVGETALVFHILTHRFVFLWNV